MAATTFPEFMRFRGLLSGAPVLPGLLGPPAQGPTPVQPQTQPTAQRSGGFGNALGQIFGGADDPNLTPEQNQQARRQALIQAGLGMLASDSTGLQAIAQGGLIGQQAGMQGRQGMMEQSQQAQTQAAVQAAMDGPGELLPRLYKVYEIAAATGNTQLATSTATLIQAQTAAERDASGREPPRGSQEWLDRERAVLELQREFAGPRNPVVGSPEWIAAQEAQARIRAQYRSTPGTTSMPGGAAQARSQQALKDLLGDLDAAEALVQANPDATGLKGMLPNVVLERMDPENDPVRAAIGNIASAIRLIRSGTAVSKSESRILDTFLPKDTSPQGIVLGRIQSLKEFAERKILTGSGLTPEMQDQLIDEYIAAGMTDDEIAEQFRVPEDVTEERR